MIKTIRILIGLLLFWPSLTVASTPLETARSFLKELVTVSTLQTIEERTDRIRGLVQGHFDFNSFYQKTLADHWTQWTLLEQLSFDHSFRGKFVEHLAKNANRIKSLHETQIRFKLSKLPNQVVKVTATGTHGGERIPVSLYLVFRNGDWKVYDLDVAGANLSRNYKGRFNYLIRNEGYSGLLAKLSTTTPHP
ncbi:MAG: ABC transporter substrate-binding protein [Deltaproteobacteria bacterium]|nr:ABC transporter substrate-binding protein [Deltaproteobacteria bacterium]